MNTREILLLLLDVKWTQEKYYFYFWMSKWTQEKYYFYFRCQNEHKRNTTFTSDVKMNTRILALLLDVKINKKEKPLSLLEVKINKKEIFLLLLDIKMNTREIPLLLLDVKMNGCRSIRPYYQFGPNLCVLILPHLCVLDFTTPMCLRFYHYYVS